MTPLPHPRTEMAPPNRGASLEIRPSARERCRQVVAIVDEMSAMLVPGGTQDARPDRGRYGLDRRGGVHRRHLAMYVAHVVLQLSLTEIGVAFGRDRTTVRYACGVVEDRRDDAAYDRFVCGIERIVSAVAFGPGEPGGLW